MSGKRRQSSTPASGTAKKASTLTLTSYLEGCVEKPDIFFVVGEAGQMQVTFPAHTAKFDALPAGSYLQGLAGMPSAEPVSLLSGITADGFCNLLCFWGRIDRDGDATFNAPNFLYITWTLLLRILQRDSLRVTSEIAVFNAAVSWATESLKRKSNQCTDAALRKELGEALFHIRFTQMPLEDFAACPGSTKILTDKEKLDIYQSRFKKDITPHGFNLRKRVEAKNRSRSVVEGCKLCGHSEDAFVKCCDMYLRVSKKAWSSAYCHQQDDDSEDNAECEGVAYRCECGAVNHEEEFVCV